MVRAKFRLNSYTTEMHTNSVKQEDGSYKSELVEKRTLNLTPVYGDDANSENKLFWQYTPTGSIQLGVVNQEAWKNFEIGKEYYVDFTPAS